MLYPNFFTPFIFGKMVLPTVLRSVLVFGFCLGSVRVVGAESFCRERSVVCVYGSALRFLFR